MILMVRAEEFTGGGDAQQRGLTAAAWTDQTQGLALSDAQADIIDRRHAGIAVPDVLEPSAPVDAEADGGPEGSSEAMGLM